MVVVFCPNALVAHLVEHLFRKQGVISSSLIEGSHGIVAQLVEQPPLKRKVGGSIPPGPTRRTSSPTSSSTR